LFSQRQTLNELLTQLDGFSERTGIIVIAATNMGESLDHALTRPGRFDRHVTVPLPDIAGRKQILELYGNKMKLASDVDLSVIARGTPGCSGALLYNLMNSAAVRASSLNHTEVSMAELEYARDKVLMGPERVSTVMSEQCKKLTAYHEGKDWIQFCNG
jgi:ATP-dependent metalloprotease